MTFIKNNREMIMLTVFLIGLFVMAASIGASVRGTQAWAYSIMSPVRSAHLLIASFLK
jgi:hypothetical protein